MATVDPLTAYLQTKKAGVFDAVKRRVTSPQFAEAMTDRAVGAGLAAGATAAVVGGAAATRAIYEAATKARDFRRMLEHDPELAQAHQENPKLFNAYYTTLRTFNPEFSRDPVTASTFMHKMLAGGSSHAGGIAAETLQYRDKLKSPVDPLLQVMLGSARNLGGIPAPVPPTPEGQPDPSGGLAMQQQQLRRQRSRPRGQGGPPAPPVQYNQGHGTF